VCNISVCVCDFERIQFTNINHLCVFRYPVCFVCVVVLCMCAGAGYAIGGSMCNVMCTCRENNYVSAKLCCYTVSGQYEPLCK
jgi:hypothetical protein